MPEPNLPPLMVYEDSASVPAGADVRRAVVVQSLRAELPELPAVTRDRLVETHGILPEHAFTLLVSIVDNSARFAAMLLVHLKYLKSTSNASAIVR